MFGTRHIVGSGSSCQAKRIIRLQGIRLRESHALKSEGKLVLGIGGNVVDQFYKVKAVPKPGEKGYFFSPHKVHESSIVGGVTLNHLSWAALLGAPSGLLALQGNDPISKQIRNKMEELHVNTNHIKIDSQYTAGQSFVFVQEDGERSIIQATGATSLIDRQVVLQDFEKSIKSNCSMLTSEICHVPLSGVITAMTIARDSGVTTALDLDVSPQVAVNEAKLGSLQELEKCIFLADILKPSKHAAVELVKIIKPDVKSSISSLDIASYLVDHYGVSMVAMTNGSQPSVIVTQNKKIEIETEPLDKVVDATGAGDAFFGGLIAFLNANGFPQSEEDMWSLGRLANKTGRICCSVLGALPDHSSRLMLQDDIESFYPNIINDDYKNKEDAPTEMKVFKKSIQQDSTALSLASNEIDLSAVDNFIELLNGCTQSVLVSGIGKSGIVARRLASSLSSVGLPSHFVHASEWCHGDYGKARAGDVAVLFSHSGKTAELVECAQILKNKHVMILSVVGSKASPLVNYSDGIIAYADAQSLHEPLGGAPTASIVLQEAVVNGVLQEIINRRRLTVEDFVVNHPGGALGNLL